MRLFYTLFLIAVSLAFAANAYAQGIYTLWGTTQIGGVNNAGVIFSTKHDGTSLQKQVDMTIAGGSYPSGRLLLHNKKLYGLARFGGAHNFGTLFEYDLLTNTYSKKVDFDGNNGSNPLGGTLVEYNNKLYGLTTLGGTHDKGVLFEYDPVTNALIKKFDFNGTNGQFPKGGLLVYNNKLYGVTSSGNATGGGVLFEYTPSSNTYTIKYQFGNSPDGRFPAYNLLLHNDKLYGMTTGGGTNGAGTIFEYDLITSSYSSKYSFLGGATGVSPYGGLTIYNNKLYGFANGGTFSYGILFDFDLTTNTFTKQFDYHWNKNTGTYPSGSLLVNNSKLYGLTSHDGSALSQFSPATNTLTVKSKFTGPNGSNPTYATLTPIPVSPAPGTLGTCQTVSNITIDASNNNEWVPIVDASGNAVAEINANGNSLGTVSTQLYVHNSAVRKDGSKKYYLDRNITVTPQFQPSSAVSVRLYIKEAEFNALKTASNASGIFPTINTINDIGVYKNDDACSNAVTSHAIPVTAASVESWGLANDYVFSASINSFSTFYFSSINNVSLPLQLTSFSALPKDAATLIQWAAKEDAESDYYEIEYSKDGQNYTALTTLKARRLHTTNNYSYTHQGLQSGIYYYRVKLVERNNKTFYSDVKTVKISHPSSFYIQVQYVGASQMAIRISTGASQQLLFNLYNSIGQKVWQEERKMHAGSYTLTLPQWLSKGMYRLIANNQIETRSTGFVKQ